MLLGAAVVVFNSRFDRRQRELAASRAGLGREEFERSLLPCGVSAEVALLVWEALSERCCEGIRPNPSDSLCEFYGLDGDHLGDLIEEAFECLALPMPSVRRPEVVPELFTAADLAAYLEARRHDLARAA